MPDKVADNPRDPYELGASKPVSVTGFGKKTKGGK